ncbi:rhodanese-like domain-containing protein [Campylobacter pinnipediorum]|uniref:Thiosulfate sulfurtransferase n=1 Tax=Campylobacter pinnipediorum subsp. pinnipediorum TaxID=1660067 RepID=A0AAX0L9A6_9BACT|nr:rhodanese-like domain-containing protein [Campylobacter pinnipediorum]AQW83663.1 putative rhodanese-related sulfurtransferase [Campylobacter pinnipediorum subsp. pinnipediorum]OPA75848.1 thiosulfate sulfurtransferase [Campylobacter pinnipediorum subsp. pinnipediorum]OPA76041.1 thiosulfate sulfurtransferase [Campylobacter pinnipediorum subsp. pinnipediorum]
MNKSLLPFACCATLFGEIVSMPANIDNISKIDQIVDIRTPAEWRETGIIKGAKTITLINDKNEFINSLKSSIDIKKPFALICRSGHRSMMATHMIDSHDIKVINLEGGMMKIMSEGYKTVPYKD